MVITDATFVIVRWDDAPDVEKRYEINPIGDNGAFLLSDETRDVGQLGRALVFNDAGPLGESSVRIVFSADYGGMGVRFEERQEVAPKQNEAEDSSEEQSAGAMAGEASAEIVSDASDLATARTAAPPTKAAGQSRLRNSGPKKLDLTFTEPPAPGEDGKASIPAPGGVPKFDLPEVTELPGEPTQPRRLSETPTLDEDQMPELPDVETRREMARSEVPPSPGTGSNTNALPGESTQPDAESELPGESTQPNAESELRREATQPDADGELPRESTQPDADEIPADETTQPSASPIDAALESEAIEAESELPELPELERDERVSLGKESDDAERLSDLPIEIGEPIDDQNVLVDPALLEEARASLAPPPAEESNIQVEEEAEPEPSARVATRIKGHAAEEGVVIGIDLGTSNTCASAVIDGQPQVIPTRWGTNTIPSVLAIIDGFPRVGHAAAKRLVLNPEETIYGSKRLLGRVFTDDLVTEYQPFFAYRLAETDDNRFGAKIGESVVSFQDVAKLLLAEVRDVAAQQLQKPIAGAVVTVPAYFSETQRDAVRRAGRAAGLTVGRIVNEPTAAAVAYGYRRKEDGNLVVIDLGGGTFDVSVLKLQGKRFEVLATGGDPFLGGIDVDDAIASHVLEEFNRQNRIELEPNPQQIARLREAAEECKRGLSVQNRFSISLPHFALVDGKALDLNVNVDREKLDAVSEDLCERMIGITSMVLDAHGYDVKDIDDVLLVGGSTRLPLVQESIQSFFQMQPSKRINPDEAVALGAALIAAEGGLVELNDVLPISIGFAGQGRQFMRLVSRNTPVPAKRVFGVKTTAKNQLVYPMPLFQGERLDAGKNEYLGTLKIQDIPPGPIGSEIELTLKLDEQCMLSLTAKHLGTRRPLRVEIVRERSAEAVVASLGPFEGEEPDEPKKKGSALGRFFKRVKNAFGR